MPRTATDAPTPPPADPAALQARIRELEEANAVARKEQAEQTDRYRRRLAEVQATADAAAAQARTLADDRRRVADEARAEVAAASRLAAADPAGRRWKVTPPFESAMPTVVLAAPTPADARERFLAACGATESSYRLKIEPTDEPLSPTGVTHTWDHARQRWEPREKTVPAAA
jgi:hypothetical protein